MTFDKFSEDYINKLVKEGKLFLFQIYSKDFSEHSKGKPNLNTLYWREIFSKENLKNPEYKLNGKAQVFFRPASLVWDKPTHPANERIDRKTEPEGNQKSIFSYDIYKDKRFRKDSYQFHVSLNFNCTAPKELNIVEFNKNISEKINENQDIRVIGIDRGERNLLYYSLIDGDGNILEQGDLNCISGGKIDGKEYYVPYKKMLSERANDRKKAQQDWRQQSQIKDLKKGYLSQVVGKLSRMMVENDAILVMEDLNRGFKNSRSRIEFSIYQQFENALLNKLSYLVLKDRKDDEIGGIRKAYQLTKNNRSEKTKQCGIVFYVNPAYTSVIDPLTGFAKLLSTKDGIKYKNIYEAREFIEKIDGIRFNKSDDIFEFDIDFSKWNKRAKNSRTKWTLYSHGTRIINKKINGKWDSKEIDLTKEFKMLFSKYNINYSGSVPIKEQFLNNNNAGFFKDFLFYFELLLQLRNSWTGNDEIDYIISPVKDENGNYFDSRKYKDIENANMPKDGDANGAYNIARKGLILVNRIRDGIIMNGKQEEYFISDEDWFKFAQKTSI